MEPNGVQTYETLGKLHAVNSPCAPIFAAVDLKLKLERLVTWIEMMWKGRQWAERKTAFLMSKHAAYFDEQRNNNSMN